MAKFLIVHHIDSYFSKVVEAATQEEAEQIALDGACATVNVLDGWEGKVNDSFIATEVDE